MAEVWPEAREEQPSSQVQHTHYFCQRVTSNWTLTISSINADGPTNFKCPRNVIKGHKVPCIDREHHLSDKIED